METKGVAGPVIIERSKQNGKSTENMMNHYDAELKTSDPKDWYILYSCRHPVTGVMKAFKVRLGINRITDRRERMKYGQKIVSETNVLLDEGWTPWLKEEKDPLHKLSLQDLLRKLEELKAPGLRKRTTDHYKHAVDLLLEYLPAPILPKQFSKVLAQGYSDWLMITKGYTSGTHNNQLSNMRTFFNAMVDRGIIDINPFKGIQSKPADSRTHVPFTDKERDLLKSYMEKNNPELLMFCKFIFYCGIRPAELMLQKIKHINWDLKNMQVTSSNAKNRKNLSTAIPDVFYKELEKAYKDVDPEYYIFSRNLKSGPIAVHRNRATELHKEVLEATNLNGKGHTMYAWKHSGAIAFIKAGGEPFVLMIQFRHHSFDQTMDYLRGMGLDPNTNFANKQPKF